MKSGSNTWAAWRRSHPTHPCFGGCGAILKRPNSSRDLCEACRRSARQESQRNLYARKFGRLRAQPGPVQLGGRVRASGPAEVGSEEHAGKAAYVDQVWARLRRKEQA